MSGCNLTKAPDANPIWTSTMMERLAAQEQVIAKEIADARGAKHDAGKARAGLMVEDFAKALAAVAHVSTMGAAKYTARSWKTVPDARDRYYDAFHRHILAAAAGEVNDPESGLPHQAHIAWNALALLELQLTEAKA